MLRHLVGVAQADAWPDNILLDSDQCCMVHQLHRLKVEFVDIQTIVSLMYCLSKLVRSGAIMSVVADYVDTVVRSKVRRVVGPRRNFDTHSTYVYVTCMQPRQHEQPGFQREQPRFRAPEASCCQVSQASLQLTLPPASSM